jgi:hypothetical protein
MALSPVSAVLARVGLGKLSRLEPPEPPNRYQRRHAGEPKTRAERAKRSIRATMTPPVSPADDLEEARPLDVAVRVDVVVLPRVDLHAISDLDLLQLQLRRDVAPRGPPPMGESPTQPSTRLRVVNRQASSKSRRLRS